MTLPSIVGIGAPKAGSTLLSDFLFAHPRIHGPAGVKELRFFDLYFARGFDWYSSFFPAELPAGDVAAEFSPQYMYSDEAFERIAAVDRPLHLVAVVRSPSTRAWSEHLHIARHRNSQSDFWTATKSHPEILDRSMYGKHLERWLTTPHRHTVHVVVLEEVTQAPQQELPRLLHELGVPVTSDVPPTLGKANASFAPRFPRLYAQLATAKRHLRRRGLERVVVLGQRAGIGKVVRSESRPAPLDAGLQRELDEHFADDTQLLERLLGRPIEAWR